MKGKWELENSRTLVVRDEEGNLIVPSAEEIYFIEFSNKEKIREVNVPKPSKCIDSLTYSKFPLNLNIILAPFLDAENFFINVSVIVEKKEYSINISELIDAEIDHIIINNIWYPFVKGITTEVNLLLNKAGVKESGRITLRQYLLFKRISNPLVIDKVGEIPIDKSEYIPKKELDIPLFVGELYTYQNQGYRWLKMIVNENAGCILADEMGLGKTAQIIAVLSSESTMNGPSLVIAPVSLLENWRREIKKFAPSLSSFIHQGIDRTGFYKEFLKYDVVITSYETVHRDLSLLNMINWNIVVADEAQAIKNPIAKRTIALKQLKRASTIAVTGTPVENRLVDIWSISDFVFPGYLGDKKEFEEEFNDELESAEKLEPIISPILLRRRVKDVAGDLPERIETPQAIKLTPDEAQLYEILRSDIIREYGESASLVSLIKLRMFCTHPFLQIETKTSDPTIFGKYMRLVEILEEIISNKEKVIIFTSFSKMSDLLLDDLAKRFNVHCDFIDGRVDVSDRQLRIDKFSILKDSAILILNPRAAGAGLNITAANHVIHYNLEWNPAIEDQASARAHRRGQTRPVTVYRLYCAETVEEVMNQRLEMKRELSSAAIVGTDGVRTDNADILEALWKSPLN
ncbi:DEAD/DEAH box helicase [Sutcliffiella horikoshii]|uniref:DEAD/DEAH box helicase n=1 Tax=Sutcliffiella horikoshii TaxID=79883 RepID=UPI003CF410B6